MDFWKKNSNLHKFHSQVMIGNISELIQYYKPSNKEEFWQKYTSDDGRGRSEAFLRDLSDKMSNYSGETSEACYSALKELILKTMDGIEKEFAFKRLLQDRGNSVEKAWGSLDTSGVDLIVNDRYYVQVKPISFFKGNNNRGLLIDRLKLLKQSDSLDKPLFIMIYDGDSLDPKPYKPTDLLATTGITKL